MIQQQMIMHGIPSAENDKKDILTLKINSSNWVDAVEENTIKKRL